MNQTLFNVVLACALAAGGCLHHEQLLASADAHLVSHSHAQYQQLSKDMTQDRAAVIAFIETDSPYANKLRQRWLVQLATEEDWQTILSYYKASNDDGAECAYLSALFHSGQQDTALAGVPRLWLVPYSQPKACDEIFEQWRLAGKLTPEMIWRRVELAIAAKEFELAQHLQQQLPEDERDKVTLWIKTSKQPWLITRTTFKRSPVASRIIRDALIQIADKRPSRAAKLWPQFDKTQDFSTADKQAILREIAIHLALKHDKRSEYWFSQTMLSDDDVTAHEWRIRAMLAQQHWPQLIQIIQNSPNKIQQKPCWQYWLARAYYATGQRTKAKSIMQSIAKKRHYYGFLASKHMQQDSHLGHQNGATDRASLQAIQAHPSVQSAKAHYDNQAYKKARVAWWHAMRSLDDDEKYLAAKLAAEWGWHEQAILTAKYANHQDDLKLRFPAPHRNTVLRTAMQFNLQPAFIYAIIRQESSFQHDAHSPDGARGVMQLLPETANDYARHLKAKQNPKQLFNIKHNIEIGGQHLKRMLKSFRGNYVYVAASYNAGMRKVQHWMRRKTVSDPTIWIETLPWVETRNYIKNVLTYTVIYQHHLGNTPDISPFLGKSAIQEFN